MPGRREKNQCLSDVTINQFADAKEPSARQTKRVSNKRSVLTRLAQDLPADSFSQAAMEHADYFYEDEDEETQEEADSSISTGPEFAAPTAASSLPVIYPAQLWQLLSDYIQPESVSTFACLCRDARRATQRRSFWRRIYLRFAWNPTAEADSGAPHELRKSAILSCHLAVRPRVIRALHRWYFVGATEQREGRSPPTGLRFLRFAVQQAEHQQRRRLLILFRRGLQPQPPKPPPDCWETEAADVGASTMSDSVDNCCTTEGQWLLVANLDSFGLPPHCLEELLAQDSRCLLVGLKCLTAIAGAGGSGVGKLLSASCELVMRQPNGECRSICFACSAAPPRLLPWWRPDFLPALRSSASSADVIGDDGEDAGGVGSGDHSRRDWWRNG